MSEELEGYITVPEAARQMGRSTEQVRRYLREGKVPGRRIGGQWFIRETGVLYRVRGEEERKMALTYFDGPEGLDEATLRERAELFQRITRRREVIRKRWDRLGVRVDAVQLVRELREEDS